MSIHATAELYVSEPDKVDATVQALRTLAEKTRTEAGCIQFDFHQDKADLRRILLWETFKDEPSLEKHMAEPHTQHYFTLGLTNLVRIIKSNRL